MRYVVGGTEYKPSAVRSIAFRLTCATNPESEKMSRHAAPMEIEREGGGGKAQDQKLSSPPLIIIRYRFGSSCSIIPHYNSRDWPCTLRNVSLRCLSFV